MTSRLRWPPALGFSPALALALTLVLTVACSAPDTGVQAEAAAATDQLVADANPAAVPLDTEDLLAITDGLQGAADAWNRGDLSGHLAGYADSTTFMSGQGPRRGVEYIRDAFTRSYFRDGAPDQELGFSGIEGRALGPNHALITGSFRLSGGGLDEQSGWFTLVWARTADGWRIIHDHSS